MAKMAEIKTIYKGESVTLLFTFPEAYDMARLASHKIFVGETEFEGAKDGQTVRLQLKSSDTNRMIGTHRIVCLIDDTTLGLRKPYCGELVIAKTQASGSTASVSNISDIIIPIVISETAITVGDVMYNYVKGDKGDPFTYSDFTPEQKAELQQPAADAISSIEAVELAVEQAEALRVTAEQSRQTNTATAILNAENATDNANDAAILANEVASNPDKVVADYWHKWNTTTKAYENTGIKAKGDAGTGATVVQTTGLSTDNVMSQKAVTNEILKLKTLTEPLAGIYATKPLLDAAFPTGNNNLYLVTGDVKEVDTLTITGGATTSGNFGVTLNGVMVYTHVLAGDTAEIVATKIRSNNFQGWTTSGSGNIIVFTDNTSRAVTAPTVTPNLTGVTSTFTRTVIGFAPDGKWYYWNNTVWTAGGEYLALLNSIENQKLETLKKTYTGAINELNNAKNKLDLMVEKLDEQRQPLYIEMGTFTTTHDAPSTNANAIIAVTAQADNVLTGNFSIWGATKRIAGVVEFSDGTYGTGLILSYNATSATFSKPFAKTVIKASCMHDVVNGQHLSDLGFYAMAQHLFNYPRKTAFRHTLVRGMNMQNHSRLSVVGNHIIFRDTLTNKISLEIDAIGGYNPAYINVASSTIEYWKLSLVSLLLNNTYPALVGGGYETSFNSDYTGYVEMFLGTDLSLAGKLCEVKLLKDGAFVETKQFSGAVERIIFNHGIGNYKIQITALDVSANPGLSGIFFWKKREITENIWKKDDRILFLTDSWGAFPEAVDPLLKPKNFDGTPNSGMAYMPMKFKDLFVAMGGRASNVILASRGGQTSEWAKYWLPYVIEQTMPTKIVFHFAINDLNSTDEFAGNTPSPYDFDPDVMWNAKLSNAGGVFGSVSKQRYIDNIKWMAEYCYGKGITPIFFMPPKTAAVSQAQTLQGWAMDIYMEGLK